MNFSISKFHFMQEWVDERLTWNKSQYFGMDKIRIPCNKLWVCMSKLLIRRRFLIIFISILAAGHGPLQLSRRLHPRLRTGQIGGRLERPCVLVTAGQTPLHLPNRNSKLSTPNA
jgi:hypothetical protein